jgi:hypothetical protein
VREEAVAAGNIDDAPATAPPPDTPRHLPGFIELLARQASDAADRAADPVEERAAGKSPEVVLRQAAVTAGRKSGMQMADRRRLNDC